MCGSVACVFTEASKHHPTVSLSQYSRSALEKGEDGAARAPKLEPGRSGWTHPCEGVGNFYSLNSYLPNRVSINCLLVQLGLSVPDFNDSERDHHLNLYHRTVDDWNAAILLPWVYTPSYFVCRQEAEYPRRWFSSRFSGMDFNSQRVYPANRCASKKMVGVAADEWEWERCMHSDDEAIYSSTVGTEKKPPIFSGRNRATSGSSC